MPQESGTQNYNELFDAALALQQAKKTDEALTAYQQILDQGREYLGSAQASAIYYNMSALAFSKSDFLKAYIWSKKAMSLNPANEQARESYQIYAKKVEIPNVPHQISNLDNFKRMISTVPSDIWVVVSLLLFLGTLWLALKRAVTVKKNRLSDIFQHPPKWPVYILSIITLIVIVMAI